MNRQKYLDRIHFTGTPEPTLEVLQRLQKLHLLNIPFENLDIHYGPGIQLDTESIFKKVVENNRGGFCYELNELYLQLLRSIGFVTRRVSARVWDSVKGYGQEYDHLVIIVTIEEREYLTDVGFGEFAFGPLRLEMNKIQHDERGDFVFDQYDEEYIRVSKIENGERVPQYIFRNIEREYSEYEGMCNYHQTSPDSHFTRKKLISLPTENGRITLTSHKLRIKEGDHMKDKLIRNDEQFEDELWRHFKIKTAQKSSQ